MSDLDATVWEDIYSGGGMANRYPWDAVVSFIMHHRPRDRARADVGIVELGCGTAPNLWFAAREGFRVAGIDISASAIDIATKRFDEEGLVGDLRVGNFGSLPFKDQDFSIALDRAALCHTGDENMASALSELARILEPGGLFFCNVYADDHSSAEGSTSMPDGRRDAITQGTLKNVGGVRFYDRDSLLDLFPSQLWEVENLKHVVIEEQLGDSGWGRHAEWRLVAKRKG